jgi:hypothetical protein
MATRARALALLAALIASVAIAGCIAPAEEAPLVSGSRNFVVTQGHSERFRVADDNGSATPEYSIFAENVLNRTALFLLNPGEIPVALCENTTQPVDLDGDGYADIVIGMDNTTGEDAYITVYIAGVAQVCTNDCLSCEVQMPFPDCSCVTPHRECAVGCSAGEAQRPYPDCSCYEENRTCSDGTLWGQCAPQKPLMCVNGSLLDNCSACQCPAGQSCSASGSCSAAQTPTPSPGASPTPSRTPTPTPAPTQSGEAAAIAIANATTEGSLMPRFDALYKKNQQCTQSEFSSTFTSRMQRAPTSQELTAFSGTKNYLPPGVSVNATLNGTYYDVVYSTTGGHGAPALKVVVATGAAVGRQWLESGVTTELNTELITTAEAIPGNCGMVMVLNGWA